MQINEIEITGASFAYRHHKLDTGTLAETAKAIELKADAFDLENALPGFHDWDFEGDTIRGFYSVIVPFEIEHLIDGNTTKSLLKRIESSEFIITGKMLITWGKPNPSKLFVAALSAATGQHVDCLEFEFQQLNQLQERMTRIKTAVLTNPKEKEVRKARLSGHMEGYAEYNIIDPRNHGIETVAGLIDTPLGPLTITVGKKGCIRLNVKKGLIITTECIEWILALIKEEKAPGAVKPPQSVF